MNDSDMKLMLDQPEPTFDKARYALFRKVLGKVQHASLYTHPEIATAVSVISQRMFNPSQLDLDLAFGILRYLWGTVGNDKATLCMKHSVVSSMIQSSNRIQHIS